MSPLPELAESEHDSVVNVDGSGTLVQVPVGTAPELVVDPELETVELERVEVPELVVADELLGTSDEPDTV
jgi:hypothetical protein